MEATQIYNNLTTNENMAHGFNNPVDQRTYEDMVTKTANSTRGNEQYYDCPKCLNREFTYYYRDGYSCMILCDCIKIRKSVKLLKESGIESSIKEKTFDRYEATEPWQIAIKQRCIEFTESFQLGKSIAMLGQSGSGKTHLCTAICGKLVEKGYSLRYVLWRDIVAKLQSNIYNNEVYSAILEDLKSVDVVYIDDMFKLMSSNPTQKNKELEIAFKILNDREVFSKSVIISSEYMLKDIKKLDEAIAGRIVKMTTSRYSMQISKSESKNYRFRDLEMF